MPSKTSTMNIPIVDFSPWSGDDSTQDKEGRLQAAQEIVNAFKTVGFVYLVNHSLSEANLGNGFDVAQRFFSLPEKEKMKVPHPEGWKVHRGYSWPGLEKISHVRHGDNEDKLKELKQVPDVKVRCTPPQSKQPIMNRAC